MKNVPRHKFTLALLFVLLASLTGAAQTYTTVSGSNVQNGQGQKLTQGMVCFSPYNSSGALTAITAVGGTPTTGPFCDPVTNGVLSQISGNGLVPNLATASPSGLNYQVTLYNQTADTVLVINWMTSVTGANWSWDSLVIPASLNANATASGVGTPYLACAAGASFTSTTSTTRPGWQCAVTNGYPQWFQTGNSPAPQPGQTATIPVVSAMIAAAVGGIVPPTTGTAILKANGTGGFGNAVPGTDYIASNASAGQTVNINPSQFFTWNGDGGTRYMGTSGSTVIINPDTVTAVTSGGTQWSLSSVNGSAVFKATRVSSIEITGVPDGCLQTTGNVVGSTSTPCGAGGGGSPAGSPADVQINLNGSSFGADPGRFTYTAGTTHQLSLVNQAMSGVLAQNYADTTSTRGLSLTYTQAAPTDTSWNGDAYAQWNTVSQSGTGKNVGNPTGYTTAAGWRNIRGLILQLRGGVSGIHQGIGLDQQDYSSGDDAQAYFGNGEGHSPCLWVAGSDEGCIGLNINGSAFVCFTTGTLSGSTTTGMVNPPFAIAGQNCNGGAQIINDGIVIDTDITLLSGNMGGQASVSWESTSLGALPMATGALSSAMISHIGDLTSNIPLSSNPGIPQSAVFSSTAHSGFSGVVAGPVMVVGSTPEQCTITTLTPSPLIVCAKFHPAGDLLFQSPFTVGFMDWNDNFSVSGLHDVMYFLGGVTTSASTTATFISGVTSITLSSSTGVLAGQVITGAGIPGSTTVVGPPQPGNVINLSAATTSPQTGATVSFSGASALIFQRQQGTPVGHSMPTRGSMPAGANFAGAVTVHPGALCVTTDATNSTCTVEQNTVAWANGDHWASPTGDASVVGLLGMSDTQPTPDLGAFTAGSVSISYNSNTRHSAFHPFFTMGNFASRANYANSGVGSGTLSAPGAITISGAVGNGLLFDTAPILFAGLPCNNQAYICVVNGAHTTGFQYLYADAGLSQVTIGLDSANGNFVLDGRMQLKQIEPSGLSTNLGFLAGNASFTNCLALNGILTGTGPSTAGTCWESFNHYLGSYTPGGNSFKWLVGGSSVATLDGSGATFGSYATLGPNSTFTGPSSGATGALNVVDTKATGASSAFSFTFFNPGLTTGGQQLMAWGLDNSNNDGGWLRFHYAGGFGSTANYVGIGLAGGAENVAIFGTGDVGINSGDCGQHLCVNGFASMDNLKINQTAASSTTASDHSIPITDATGTVYYIRVSATP